MTSHKTAAELVGQYARRFNSAHLTSHGAGSPLGLWMLLALVSPLAQGEVRQRLEEALGAKADEACRIAKELIEVGHPDVKSALAFWVDLEEFQPDMSAFTEALPEAVERGGIPTQEQADGWAREGTNSLIERFPVDMKEETVLVLASALASEISWRAPLQKTASPGSGILGGIKSVLFSWDVAFFETEAAGVVAVTKPPTAPGLKSAETLGVYSVIGEAQAPLMHEAAQEVASGRARRLRLFELPLGKARFWSIDEVEGFGERERAHAILPAWEAGSSFTLSADAGVAEVFETLAGLAKEQEEIEFEAKQAAYARFDAEGFKAAAVTAIEMRAGSMLSGRRAVRRAEVTYDGPYAVLGVARAEGSAWDGVPVFSAWVEKAQEA